MFSRKNSAEKASRTIMLFGNSLNTMLNFRKALIADLIARSFRVVVIAPLDIADASELEEMGAIYAPISLNRWGMNPFAELMLVLGLLKLMLKWRPSLVMSYTIKPNLYALPLCRLMGVKSIGVVTGLGYVFLKNSAASRLARASLKASLKLADHVFFLNTSDLNHVVGKNHVLKRKSSVLPGEGVDTSYFAPAALPAGATRFIMIARLLTDKGFEEYVEAAKTISAAQPEISFGILGPFDAHNPSAVGQDELDAATNLPNITYLGDVGDVRPFIAAAHCVVLPSYREGISRALLEAGAMARPSITSDVAGCNDVVVDGETGLLCAPRSAESLADCMRTFAQMDHRAVEQMGQMARERIARHFSQQAVLNAYQDILGRLGV